ncbi:MAG: hypothetical protein COW67_02435 [Flavobacteriales bacterium CG18_big_fil_WC_8_21_14_2_50_32_9]|nr:MAG: hypothetical protein COW67_02435 [Flavobacteriales bacterium CG18_big_fil_WC_8_21_14_2_50_32_9]PJC61806.1 MAG: hypothetical protein CO022_07890 [Flavobacteriales bacterium CG_4_9_14_0_2_um_filter_32_27]
MNKNKIMIKSIFLSFVLLCSLISFAQDDLLNMLEEEVKEETTSEKVTATFKGTKLINANTIETTKKKTLAFNITHRFGDMQIGEPIGYHTYYGLDNASNIRFGFEYGLTDKISIGFGRSKIQEHYDWNLKYRFLEQKAGGMPISAAYYTNIAITAVAKIKDDAFVNRLSYVHQLIIASKLNNSISLEILPTLVHRNLVDQRNIHPTNGSVDKNDLFALGLAGRFKVTKRMAFVVDYFYTFSEFRDSRNNFYDALGLGIEIETGGHVFMINVTNSAGIIENDFLPYTNSAWDKGEYKLGFNISRVFSF